MTAWSELPWGERLARLGDEAERVYELDRTNRKVRFSDYGLRRPDFTGKEMAQLPASVRHGPDYIESWGGRLRYMEVQGCGEDQRVKVKDAKLDALEVAAMELPVHFFLWNSPERRFLDLPLAQVALLLRAARLYDQVGVFDRRTNPKPYTWVSWRRLAANAEQHRVAPPPRAVQMGAPLAR